MKNFSSKEFKLIGSFVSARKAAIFLGISTNTVIKYKNSGDILKIDINFHLNNLEKLWIKFHYMLETPKALDTIIYFKYY